MGEVKCLTMKGVMNTIMAEICDTENDFEIVVKNPVMVIVIPPRTSSDSSSVAFTPFLNYTEEFGTGINIHRSDVLTTTTPVVELLNQYNSVFGSGIVLASGLTK
jgi:hypothetical protein